MLGMLIIFSAGCGGGGSDSSDSTSSEKYGISGTISGDVVSGVTVTLSGDSSASTTTDSSGNYSFTNQEKGDYTVTPSLSGYTFSPSSQDITISDTNEADIDFTSTTNSSSTTNYSISGTVSGDVASGVTVTLSGDSSGSTTTDSSGNFSFTGAANGSYTLTASKSGYTFSPTSISVTVNSANVTGQNFTATIIASSTYSISGTVSGAVLSGVTITLTGTGSSSATTNSSGNFSFTGAVNGSYTLTPSKTGYTFSPTVRSITVNGANITGQNFTATASTSSTGYDSSDILSNNTFGDTIEIDFSANTAKLSSDSTALSITTGGVTPLTGVTVQQTTYGITITSTVSEKIKYTLTGTLSGTLTVSSDSAYQLYLNGVTINGSAGPALDLESTAKAFIVAASGTTNRLTDASSRSMTMKASVYGAGPIIFSGSGTLNVTGSYKHGIFSDDYIRVLGTTLNVTVSAKDAVRSVNGFIFDEGTLTITATGKTTDDESKGIIVEGVEGTGAGKGFIVINGGNITVTSVGKAITAGWDIDEDATTSTTSDDPNPYMIINNGVITLTTTGTPYEYASGGTTISCSPEGLEAKTSLTINGGYITINTSDDAINAGKSITFNDGYIYAKSSKNDAIDSNGTLTINGGVIVAIGSGAPEGAFDCDVNTFAVTGGTFVGIGGTVSRPTAGYVTQNLVILGSLTSGTTMALKASDGTVAFAFKIPQSYATMILSSPEIDTGTKYSVYTGGTATATTVFNGLYIGSLTYSGGSTSSNFTVSSTITKIGGVYF
jgi:hypothetical protein